MDISVVDPLQKSDWDESVARYPDAGFFHGSAWARTLNAAYGYEPRYLIWKDAFASETIVPVMEVRSPLTGRRGISLPFTDFCEPLHSGDGDASKLRDHLLRFGREARWNYFECRGGRSLFRGGKPSSEFYGHSLDLSSGPDRLRAGCRASVRRAVRKALDCGVTVRKDSSWEAMESFYRLQCQTRRRHGLPPQPLSFFAALHRHVLSSGNGFVFLAEHSGVPVAAAVFVHFARKAIFKYGASDPRRLALRANDLVMWQAIEWHSRHGFEHLSFGRTEVDNQGLRRYKLGFGAAEAPLRYFRFDYSVNDFVTVKKSGMARVFRPVFQRLPVALGRVCGALLYRHVA